MNKVAVFICDTQNITKSNSINENENQKNCMQLNELLDLIRIKTKSDKLFFSLICGAREPKLLESIKKIETYFEGTDIELDIQYSLRHGFDSNGNTIFSFINPDKTCRVEKIIYHIQMLMKNYEITWVGFSDDTYCKFNEAHRKLSEAFPDIEIQTICANDIGSLNQALINYLGLDINIINENIPDESFDKPKIKTLKGVTKS